MNNKEAMYWSLRRKLDDIEERIANGETSLIDKRNQLLIKIHTIGEPKEVKQKKTN